jgi:hypothetical protein
LPAASFVTAESCCVAPAARVALEGLTDTEATGVLVKVTAAVAVKPIAVAVTV